MIREPSARAALPSLPLSTSSAPYVYERAVNIA
jgi:hypothetical protein